MRERKFWGWGYSDELLTDEEDKNIEQRILNNFSLSEVETIPIPKAKDIELHKSKISPPSSLQNLLSSKDTNFTFLNFISIFLSFIFSYITIKFFLNYVKKFSLNIFVIY